MEHCSSCGRDFPVDVTGREDSPSWVFTCPYCDWRVHVDNIQKIVWVKNDNGWWHTKLVNKYVKPDGKTVLRFDYFDTVKT